MDAPVFTTPLGIADAKTHLPELVRQAIYQRRLSQISARGRGESAVLLAQGELLRLLAAHRLGVQASAIAGEFVVTISDMSLVGAGPTLDEALDELQGELDAYVDDYFQRLDFYRQTDRGGHFGRLLRYALTEPAQRRALLEEEESHDPRDVPVSPRAVVHAGA